MTVKNDQSFTNERKMTVKFKKKKLFCLFITSSTLTLKKTPFFHRFLQMQKKDFGKLEMLNFLTVTFQIRGNSDKKIFQKKLYSSI